MARPPDYGQLTRESLQDAPAWVERLLRPLNTLGQGTRSALQGGLTFADNLAAEVREVTVTVPATEGAFVAAYTSGAAQTVASGASPVVDFATRVVDARAAVTTGAGWALRIPFGMAGTYRVEAALTFVTAAGGALYPALYRNGSEVARLGRQDVPGTLIAQVGGGATLSLAAGDTLDVRAFQNTGVNATLEAGQSRFSLHLLHATDTTPLVWANPLTLVLQRLTVAPALLWLARCQDASTKAALPCGQPAWAPTTVDGRPAVRLSRVPGLTPGARVTLTLVLAAG